MKTVVVDKIASVAQHSNLGTELRERDPLDPRSPAVDVQRRCVRLVDDAGRQGRVGDRGLGVHDRQPVGAMRSRSSYTSSATPVKVRLIR